MQMNHHQAKLVILNHIFFDSSCRILSELPRAISECVDRQGRDMMLVEVKTKVGLSDVELLHWGLSSPVQVHSARAVVNVYGDYFN